METYGETSRAIEEITDLILGRWPRFHLRRCAAWEQSNWNERIHNMYPGELQRLKAKLGQRDLTLQQAMNEVSAAIIKSERARG